VAVWLAAIATPHSLLPPALGTVWFILKLRQTHNFLCFDFCQAVAVNMVVTHCHNFGGRATLASRALTGNQTAPKTKVKQWLKFRRLNFSWLKLALFYLNMTKVFWYFAIRC